MITKVKHPLSWFPALKVVLLFITGILLAKWNNLPFHMLISANILLLLLSIILSRRKISQVFLFLTIITSGALAFTSFQPSDNYPPVHVTVEGIILETPVKRYDQTFFALKINTVTQGELPPVNIHGKIHVKRQGSVRGLKAGMEAAVDGCLSPVQPRRNPGDFNSKAWRERNGFIGELVSEADNDFAIVNQNIPLIYRIRSDLSLRIEKYNGKDSPLIKALLLGIRQDIEPELKENLRVTGLSHLLALSGLHIGFLAGIMIAVGAILRLSPRWRYGLAIVGILMFLALVPARSCTLRAGIMSSAFLVAPVLKRWSPPLNILSSAALIILCLRPGDLLDAGFQLSFAAVGGIIVFYPLSENVNNFFKQFGGRFVRFLRQFLLKPFLVSCSATVSVLPLTAYHFGLASFGSPLFNLAALPLLALIFASAWLVIGLSYIWSSFAALMTDGLSIIIAIWKWMTQFFAGHAPCWCGRLAPIIVILLILSVIWLSVQRRNYRKKIFVFLIMISAVLIWSFSSNNRDFQAWFLDVGHGDAQMWRFPNDQIAVIDGGPVSRSKYGGAVKRMLEFYHIESIDLMVATHPEADHIGGLIELPDDYPVGLALKSTVSSETKTYGKLCRASDENDLIWHTAVAGSEIGGLPEGFRVQILASPAGSENWSANNASVVLLLEMTVGNDDTLRLLTTGDIEARGERALVRRGGIDAELLKIPHHGSPTSSSPEFIAAVDPRLAVVMRGGGNENRRYLPIDEVLSRLRADGIEIHHTGEEGAILFEPVYHNGKAAWQVVDWRNPTFIAWLFGRI